MYAFGKMMRKLISDHNTTQAEICRVIFGLVSTCPLMPLPALLHLATHGNTTNHDHLGRGWDAKKAPPPRMGTG